MIIGGVIYLYVAHYITSLLALLLWLLLLLIFKLSMLLCKLNRLFTAGFFLEADWSLYLSSALVGLGAAFIWTGNNRKPPIDIDKPFK